MKRRCFWKLLTVSFLFLTPSLAYAVDENLYRQFFSLDSRKLVWFLAQMHLFFGAFVLGVPLFAVIIEIAGRYTGDKRYDDLAREFTSLLSIAFTITAALGGLLSFALFSLYPSVMVSLIGVFKGSMLLYALLFFAETLALYTYYYGWNRLQGRARFNPYVRLIMKGMGFTLVVAAFMLSIGDFLPEMRGDTKLFMAIAYLLPLGGGLIITQDKKSIHILAGIILIVAGTAIMQSANSWVGFMMSPEGVGKKGELLGSAWHAFDNPLATPLAIHRMLGNLTFGGLVAGAYAAVKFISSRSAKDKAHYDWMGYISNLVAIVGLIPLPLAGYYLGREIYSVSPVMGNNMMGGDFSWTFILQAMLVGSLFMISNYYLWNGMMRIPGSERYYRYIKFILAALVISFAVWITPHNLPLSGNEMAQMGGSQHHPTLKFLGLMPAKNAVINLIIISTFFSFLIYRRGNRGEVVPIRKQGLWPRVVILATSLFSILVVGRYGYTLFHLDPGKLNLPPETVNYFRITALSMGLHCVSSVVATFLALKERGKLGQGIHLFVTTFNVVIFLGVVGFVVMNNASPFMRNIAVSQFLQLISCLLLVSVIDLFLFRGAKIVGRYEWGKINIRSQYALLLLTSIITLTMGLMGYVRSGLRRDWHIYGVLRDTSQWAFPPSHYTMTQMVGLTTLVFLLLLGFIFWLGDMRGKGKSEE